MKRHSLLFTRPWMLPVVVGVLIAAHVIFFDRLRHAKLSLALMSGLVILAIAKHLGVLGSLLSLFRCRSRHS